jgi:hypothetical protein
VVTAPTPIAPAMAIEAAAAASRTRVFFIGVWGVFIVVVSSSKGVPRKGCFKTRILDADEIRSATLRFHFRHVKLC